MNKIAAQFLESLRATLLNTHSLSKFIEEETFINGGPFSFKGHEYQEYVTKLIENNPGYTFSITKPSQIGLSEWAYRLTLGKMAIERGTAVLLSMPSKLFSQEVLKTRVTTIIDESPRLQALINKSVDSASVKQFINNSILYALSGSKSSNSNLLNRPISCCLIDEVDRQHPDIMTGFRSRMTHTPPHKRLIIKISTPTASGIGIDAEVKESREIHTAMVECEHCGHAFEPDFYEDVVIPGHNEDLRLLNKSVLARVDYSGAYLQCKECKKPIIKRATRWDVEINPLGKPKTIGVKLNPFIAPEIISIVDLIESAVEYTSSVEFLNQGLGKVADMKDSSIQIQDIHFESVPPSPSLYIFGLDLGKYCHFMSGRLNNDSTIHVEEAHVVKLGELEEFMEQKLRERFYVAGVADSQPYSDLIYRLVNKHPQLYSAIYISPTTPIPELFKLSIHDKYEQVVRQIAINKSPMMDLLNTTLGTHFTFEPSPMQGIIIKHLLDMRRVRDYRFEEMIYQWIKSKNGDDHFFHTLVYLYTASKLATAGLIQTSQIPVMVHKFRGKMFDRAANVR
jgi:hypothetical protein